MERMCRCARALLSAAPLKLSYIEILLEEDKLHLKRRIFSVHSINRVHNADGDAKKSIKLSRIKYSTIY